MDKELKRKKRWLDALKIAEILFEYEGYHKAEVVIDYGLLMLLKKHNDCLIVMLKGKGKDVKAFLDYEYYQYLTDRGYGDYSWKVKGKEDPILFYVGKELAAVVMPYKV